MSAPWLELTALAGVAVLLAWTARRVAALARATAALANAASGRELASLQAATVQAADSFAKQALGVRSELEAAREEARRGLVSAEREAADRLRAAAGEEAKRSHVGLDDAVRGFERTIAETAARIAAEAVGASSQVGATGERVRHEVLAAGETAAGTVRAAGDAAQRISAEAVERTRALHEEITSLSAEADRLLAGTRDSVASLERKARESDAAAAAAHDLLTRSRADLDESGALARTAFAQTVADANADARRAAEEAGESIRKAASEVWVEIETAREAAASARSELDAASASAREAISAAERQAVGSVAEAGVAARAAVSRLGEESDTSLRALRTEAESSLESRRTAVVGAVDEARAALAQVVDGKTVEFLRTVQGYRRAIEEDYAAVDARVKTSLGSLDDRQRAVDEALTVRLAELDARRQSLADELTRQHGEIARLLQDKSLQFLKTLHEAEAAARAKLDELERSASGVEQRVSGLIESEFQGLHERSVRLAGEVQRVAGEVNLEGHQTAGRLSNLLEHADGSLAKLESALRESESRSAGITETSRAIERKVGELSQSLSLLPRLEIERVERGLKQEFADRLAGIERSVSQSLQLAQKIGDLDSSLEKLAKRVDELADWAITGRASSTGEAESALRERVVSAARSDLATEIASLRRVQESLATARPPDASARLAEIEGGLRRMQKQLDSSVTAVNDRVAEQLARLAVLAGAAESAASRRKERRPAAPRESADAPSAPAARPADLLLGPKRAAPTEASGNGSPMMPVAAEVYALSDAGKDTLEIARAVGRPRGEIELILNLRSAAKAIG